MRTLLRWLVVTLGIAALVRWLRHRTSAPPIAARAEEDPAEELRRKLAETRAVEQETTHQPAPEPEASVDERRAAVHAQGKAAVADMTSSDED